MVSKEKSTKRKHLLSKKELVALSSLGLGYLILNSLMPKRNIELPKYQPQPHNWSDRELTISWLGHASFLINFYGKIILIDPVLGTTAGITMPGNFNLGAKRYVAPALKTTEVGNVDLLLVSHGHADHFDYPTLRKLQSYNTTVITAGNTLFLWEGLRYQEIKELWWGEIINIDGVIVKAIKPRHQAARLPWLKDMTANSLLISYGGVNIFYAGDTGYTPYLKEQLQGIPIDIAIFGIANYLPKYYQENHCTPEEAWQMAKEIGAKWVIPMHWGTFKLSEEPLSEPLPRFLQAVGMETNRIPIRAIGQDW